jgi:hypothetical protein
MTSPQPAERLAAAIRAGASGICSLEAACELHIGTGWLHRDDFARLVRPETLATSAATELAEIDWQAVVASRGTGQLPCSAGERRVLELAASLAGHRPVVLGDAVPGLDNRSVQMLVRAVLHASGQRQFP